MKNILNFKKITHPCNIFPISHTYPVKQQKQIILIFAV